MIPHIPYYRLALLALAMLSAGCSDDPVGPPKEREIVSVRYELSLGTQPIGHLLVSRDSYQLWLGGSIEILSSGVVWRTGDSARLVDLVRGAVGELSPATWAEEIRVHAFDYEMVGLRSNIQYDCRLPESSAISQSGIKTLDGAVAIGYNGP